VPEGTPGIKPGEGTRQRCQLAANTRRIADLSPSWASEITSFTPFSPRFAKLFRNVDQKVSASEGPMCRPTISRLPSVFTATCAFRPIVIACSAGL
jgi:hypothetical protein